MRSKAKPLNKPEEKAQCAWCGSVANAREIDLDWFLDHQHCRIAVARANSKHVSRPIPAALKSILVAIAMGIANRLGSAVGAWVKERYGR